MGNPDSAVIQLRLRPGQCYRFHACAADRLRVRSGRAWLVEPPAWLAEQMLGLRHRLGCGQTHLCARRGWYCLEADGEAELELVRHPGPACRGSADGP